MNKFSTALSKDKCITIFSSNREASLDKLISLLEQKPVVTQRITDFSTSQELLSELISTLALAATYHWPDWYEGLFSSEFQNLSRLLQINEFATLVKSKKFLVGLNLGLKAL